MRFPYRSVYGGGETHTMALVDFLRKKGATLEFVGSDDELLREFAKREIHARRMWGGREPVTVGAILLFPFTTLIVGPRIFWNLLLRRLRKVDTLYCLSLTEKLLATLPARLFGMRVIWVEHSLFDRWLTQNPYRLLYVLFSRWVDLLVISKALQKGLVDMGVKSERITVVYNGITLDIPEASRQRIDHDFIIGFVGRLSPEKGVDVLLRTTAELVEHLPNVRVVLVGDGPERKQLSWLARELGIGERVQFVGFQQDVKRWMLGFDLVVLPSIRRESFGIVLLEAMACSRPVIASRIGGIPEIIEHEKTGFLVEAGNAHELAEKILWVEQHPQETLACITRAKHNVQERFSQQTMFHHLELFFGWQSPSV